MEISTRFNLTYEHEWTGYTASTICKKYGVSRKTYYISAIIDTRKKEWKLYPTDLEHLIILNTRN
jgi:hypothetical protein